MTEHGILKPGRNCLEISEIKKAGILLDGSDYYRAFHDAAKRARRSILISGWQFDSGVRLLKNNGRDVTFLDFLKDICEKEPGLKVYILAWDYQFFFSFERERGQKEKFDRAHPNIFFHFDRQHALAASHHQKFVVIDEALSFVGGMDICAGRWDDRAHAAQNALRIGSNGRDYGPYHDVQSYLVGPASKKLAQLFMKSWEKAAGNADEIPAGANETDWPVANAITLKTGRVGISRTKARSIVRWKKPIKEIKRLYADAIASAQKLIYIENQYFCSVSIYRGLAKKMRSTPAGLQLIIVIPKMDQNLRARIYTGIAQKRMLNSLKRIARRRGHRLGVYYPAAPAADGTDVPVFIHSKIMIVDDRFMTVGSANANNRSMGLDTELNVSWEALNRHDAELKSAINEVRTKLLCEHAGLDGKRESQALSRMDGLVDFLETVADDPKKRLRRHRIRKAFFLSRWISALKLDRMVIDPEKAVIDENIHHAASIDRKSPLKRIINFIKLWQKARTGRNGKESKKR